MGARLTLTNNEIKYIIRVIKYLEYRGVLLKGTNKEIINQKGGLLSKILGLLIIVGLPLMKNVLARLAKSVLIQFGLTTAASATDPAILKKSYESGMATLTISSKEIKDAMEIVKYFQESGLLNKGVNN